MIQPHKTGITAGLGAAFSARYLDVVASIYIYNEHRGYTSLDRVLDAVRARCPDDRGFIAEIVKHRADEHKHYHMFRRWFELQGRMPLALGSGFGHIDRFIQAVFGCTIDDLDTDLVVADASVFERLCRVIMLTEQRGYTQVGELLGNRIIMADPVLARIFRIIHKDEPDHYLPYERWLTRNHKATAHWRERAADWSIHKALMFGKLPALFLDAGALRITHWPHESDPVIALAA